MKSHRDPMHPFARDRLQHFFSQMESRRRRGRRTAMRCINGLITLLVLILKRVTRIRMTAIPRTPDIRRKRHDPVFIQKPIEIVNRIKLDLHHAFAVNLRNHSLQLLFRTYSGACRPPDCVRHHTTPASSAGLPHFQAEAAPQPHPEFRLPTEQTNRRDTRIIHYQSVAAGQIFRQRVHPAMLNRSGKRDPTTIIACVAALRRRVLCNQLFGKVEIKICSFHSGMEEPAMYRARGSVCGKDNTIRSPGATLRPARRRAH